MSKTDEQRDKFIIIPENLRSNYVKEISIDNYDEYPVRYPLYEECIINAFNSIFENNAKQKANTKREGGYGKQGTNFKSPDNANNIFAFIGGRGSGKTTAINEFGRILMEFGTPKVNEWCKDQLQSSIDVKNIGDIHFIVLDSIDASLLTASEDIVELVLAQLYALVEKEIQNDKINKKYNSHYVAEIMESFDDAYRNYHNLCKGENEKELGENVSVILKNIPGGFNVRKAFSKLLEKVFAIMKIKNNEEAYLVITIDDLDLNIKYGYNLLEQIRKYLSDSRIIVLVAIEFEQLSLVSESYWLSQYGQEYKEEKRRFFNGKYFDWEFRENKYRDNASDLSQMYLLKAIPIENRIYMPSNRESVQGLHVYEDKKKTKSVKQYIFEKLVKKLGIFYDVKGTKRHFAVPTSIREFVSYNNFLDSLYDIDWKGASEEAALSHYDWNHGKMNKDITSRMAHLLLKYDQKKEFDNLVEKNIVNMAKYAVDFLHNWISGETKDRVDSRVYRYADLLQELYEVGRNDYRDKKLVHCVIAHFTSEMTWQYYKYCFSAGKEKARAEEILHRFLGASFGNEWLGEILPLTYIRGKKASTEHTQDEIPIEQRGYIKKAQLNILELRGTIMLEGEKEWSEKLILKRLEESKEIQHSIEILGFCMMLFSNFRRAGRKIPVPEIDFFMKAGRSENMDRITTDELRFEVSFRESTADFDILGFIGKKYNRRMIGEFASNILAGIKSGVKDFLDLGDEEFLEVPKDLKDMVNTALGKFMGDNFMAFPFYNLDLSYNVLKRARSNSMDTEGLVNLRNLYPTIKRIYGYIAVELYAEDKEYEEYDINRNGKYWSKEFVTCPFIKAFGITLPEERNQSEKEGIVRVLGKGKQKYILESKEVDMVEKFFEELADLFASMQIPQVGKDSPDD